MTIAGVSTILILGVINLILVLFQAASVVDGSDGEVAKLTHSSSPNGSRTRQAIRATGSDAGSALNPPGPTRLTARWSRSRSIWNSRIALRTISVGD